MKKEPSLTKRVSDLGKAKEIEWVWPNLWLKDRLAKKPDKNGNIHHIPSPMGPFDQKVRNQALGINKAQGKTEEMDGQMAMPTRNSLPQGALGSRYCVCCDRTKAYDGRMSIYRARLAQSTSSGQLPFPGKHRLKRESRPKHTQNTRETCCCMHGCVSQRRPGADPFVSRLGA
jgi:hypothetical protein